MEILNMSFPCVGIELKTIVLTFCATMALVKCYMKKKYIIIIKEYLHLFEFYLNFAPSAVSEIRTIRTNRKIIFNCNSPYGQIKYKLSIRVGESGANTSKFHKFIYSLFFS